ncbi:MAG: hypothetical protein F4190_02465 [Acidimicrobiales bacterium]|nr:hypothetical protein [Acidimicrobiaceae bacterium]MXX44512.1 hypothetical protein [Acidimicrobiales bacterium]MXZ15127.1 hypothetical protein [Acidimicrobiales bacterium]MYA83395.1 hypothetical protein [Acidimicrobiales bacterium]MYG62689.1 hypothetical protein [Acidimicrobiales bacterium]
MTSDTRPEPAVATARWSQGPQCRPRVGTPARGEHGSTSAIELMALTPMCALMVLLIAWAGNSAHAELATSLAAQEAAVAAAVCCGTDADAPDVPLSGGDQQTPRDPAESHSAVHDQATTRQIVAESVVTGRPSLAQHCLDGPQPAGPDGSWATHTTIGAPDGSTAVQAVTVHITCLADGTAAPMRGLFGTRTVHGHGTRITTTHSPTPRRPK